MAARRPKRPRGHGDTGDKHGVIPSQGPRAWQPTMMCGRTPTGGAQCLRPCSCGRRGRRPSRRSTQGGAQSPVPGFLRTARTRSLPYNHRGWGTVPCARSLGGARCPGGAQSSAPDILADRGDTVPPKDPLREGRSPLRPIFLRTAGTRSLPGNHRGRGTVLRARYSCGCWGRRRSRGIL
jgi:hypothetical protein